MSITLTPDQLHILQHSLGLDAHGQPRENYRSSPDDDFPGCYRNRYYAGPGHYAWAGLQALVAAGAMQQGKPQDADGSCYFWVLAPGYAAVKAQSPAPPKVSRGKLRWQQYLSWKDAWQGSFPEFLAWMKAHDQSLA